MISLARATVMLVCAVVLLCLVVLPVLPRTETASAELRTAKVERTGTLLGEGQDEPSAPADPTEGRKESTSPDEELSSTMRITVPKLGLKNVAVTTGSSQSELDREGILRLRGSGLPWVSGSNTFITGHALGYSWTRVPYAFYKLEKMVPGDEIIIKDSEGKRYRFRVYDRLTVEPNDYWVTYPVEGKTVVSLQSCTPIPTFENRVVVRGELET